MDKLLNHYQKQLSSLQTETQALMEKYHNLQAVNLEEIEQPEVKYLIETFAFMNARISKSLEDQFPLLSKNFLEAVAPHCLRDLPGLSLLHLKPKADLDRPVLVPKGTVFETVDTQNIYRVQSCHDFDLLPLEITSVNAAKEETAYSVSGTTCLSIKLKMLQPDLPLRVLGAKRIRFYIDAPPPYAEVIYETLMTKTKAIELLCDGRQINLDISQLINPGFAEVGKILPYHQGTRMLYRLLLEFFHYRRQFLAFELNGLACLAEAQASQFEIRFYCETLPKDVMQFCSKETILTSVVPAVNLNAVYLDPIIFNYTQFDYPLTYSQGNGQAKIYDVVEVRENSTHQALDWKVCRDSTMRLELSLPETNKMKPQEIVASAKAWVYDTEFGQNNACYQLQPSETLLPIEGVKTVCTSPVEVSWSHKNDLLHWVDHLQFSLEQIQGEGGLTKLKNHLFLYVHAREPWQNKLVEALQDVKIKRVKMRLPGEVYAVGAVVVVECEVDQSAFAHHSLHLFAGLLEALFLNLVELGTGVQVSIHDQYKNTCYQGKLRLGEAL